ncbi:MAG: peptidoglycan DD-metalloendopeptidase family protein [Thermodesulfobacteriota bacterium]|nr:peptidoglycan DD-metalloendopeptidase family protein [Thermodesulfobacteriota bacterium]
MEVVRLFKIFLLVFILFVNSVYAEKIYKYKDERGIYHYSNICPDTDYPIEIEQVRVDKVEKRVSVRNIGTEREPILSVWNEYGGPIEVEFTIVEGDNMFTIPQLPIRLVIPALSKKEAVRILPIKKDQSWVYPCNYLYCLGDPKAEHLPTKPYRAPFQFGRSFRISQAFNGEYSHNTPQNQYAIDIEMPERTPVCAARDGVVMDIANDFFIGGTDSDDYRKRANFIRIVHDDGTMAVYAHLSLESIRVGIGTRVYEGDMIAESGNTGFSSGPHLHFAIQKNTGMQLMSVPFKVENKKGTGVTPSKNMMLTVY